MIWETTTTEPAETENLAEKIGRNLEGGEIIELVSDLGGGKTTFTRGLARGAGSSDAVSSPTFTLSKVYKTPKLNIHHFDFYRLNDVGILEHELHDLLHDSSSVVVIEWGEIVNHVLPKERLTVSFRKLSDEQILITLNYPEPLNYLLT